MEIIERHIGAQLEEALEWARVVMLHGARQCGKSTLARAIVEHGREIDLVLENPSGDVVAVEISHIGTLRNPVVREKDPAAS